MATDLSRKCATGFRRNPAGEQPAQYEFRILFNGVHDVIFLCDVKTGRIIDANARVKDTFGYTVEEVVGLNLAEISVGKPPYTHRKARLLFLKAALKGPQIFLWEVTRKNGHPFLGEITLKRCDLFGNDVILVIVRDITEQHRAETSLRAREELLRGILESTADGILAVDSEGKVTHCNRRFAELWRIPESVLKTEDDDQLIGFVLDQLIDPEAFLSKVRELYNSPEESFDTLEFKDGRLFERFSCPLTEEDKIIGRVWNFRDVTDHKRALTELQAQEARLAEAQRVAGLGNWEYYVDNNNISWSEELGRIFGLEENNCCGDLSLFLSAVHPDDRFSVLRSFVVTLKAGRAMDLVFRIVIPGGQIRFVHQKGTVGTNKAGDRVRLYGTIHDITSSHRMNEARRLVSSVSEEAAEQDLEALLGKICNRLGDLIDTTNFYVALYDPKEDTYSFPYSRDLYDGIDFSQSQLKRSLTDYVRRTGQPLLCDERTREKLIESGEIELIGHPSPIWLGVPIKASGETMGVVVVQHYSQADRYNHEDLDLLSYITVTIGRAIERNREARRQQELQSKLERAQRMESLGILAGGVAHDLNNTLGPLVGYPELVLKKLPADSPVRKQVERIGQAARDAADVIQDLLTMARRGRFELNPINVNDVFADYFDSPGYLRVVGANPEVSVDIDLGKDLPPVRGSAPHLSKVFMNLIINAFDAMPEGGRLTIQTSHEYLSALIGGHDGIEPGDYVIVRVKDTGIGISKKDLERIFEPYYSKKNMGSSGSGLGLSIVYGIVKDHKGFYDVFSEPGEGTEFVLYFPAAISSEQETTAESKKDIRGNESLLVVDDSDDQRELACTLLAHLGYTVDSVANGHEAVRYLADHDVDLVLLDMIMEPGFDGLETYREILKIHPGQKAVVVSGFSATERVSAMQDLGAGQYVRKPYTQTELGRAVREELDRQTTQTSA